jgi:hypothetical protein
LCGWSHLSQWDSAFVEAQLVASSAVRLVELVATPNSMCCRRPLQWVAAKYAAAQTIVLQERAHRLFACLGCDVIPPAWLLAAPMSD